MEILTSIIAFIGSVIILSVSPIKGLATFYALLCWYPQPLTISMGSVDFSVGRILILVVIFNIIVRTSLLKKFSWSLLDSLVLVFIILKFVTISKNAPANIYIQREAGNLFDTILPYFATRFIIITKKDLLIFLKSIVFISLPLAVLGAIQSVTGINAMGFLSQ